MFEVFGLGAEFTFDSEGTEQIDNIVNQMQRFSSMMNMSESDVRQYASTLNDFGDVLQSMGTKMMVAGAATTALALKGISNAADWQTQMVDASRYMADDSAAGQAAYNKELKETAQLLGTTKEEINAAAIAYMQMGKAQDDALRLAKNAGYAGVAWDITADEVAESFKSIKAAFNINLEDQDMYQKYLDNINEVGNSTAATSKDVVRFLAAGGAALHNTSRVTIEEAMGMAAGMSAATLPVGEFSTMMIRLGNNFSQGKLDKHFKALGVSTKDSSGELRSFSEVLYDVQKQWNTLDEIAKSSFLTGAGGVYADRLALYMGVGEEYKKGTKIAQADNTGSAEAEFNRVTDTFAFAMSRFKVTLSDFGAAFWGTMLPYMTKFVKVVDSMVTGVSDFAQEHPMVMKFAAGFILLSGTLLTVGGGMLVFLGTMVKLRAAAMTGYSALRRFSIAGNGLSTVFGGLGNITGQLVFKMTKLSLVTGMVYIAWKYDLFNIRSMYEDFSSRLKLQLETTRKLCSDGISLGNFKTEIQSLNDSNSVFDKVTLGLTKVGMAFKGIGQYITQGGLSVDMFQKLNALGLMPFISIVLGLGMRVKALFGGIKTGFIDTIGSMNKGIRTVFGPAFTWVHDKVLLPFAKTIFGIEEDVDNLGEVVKNGIQFVDLDAMFGKIEKWERVGKVIGTVASAFFILSMATKGLGALSGVAGMLGVVGGLFGHIIGGVGGIGGGLFSGILGALFGGMGSGGGNGGSGSNGSGFSLGVPNPKNILKGMADIVLILGGFTLIIEAYGYLSTVPGFDVFMSKGIAELKHLFMGVSGMVVGLGELALITAIISAVNPGSFIKGMTDIALILGGFTLIFEAYGRISQVAGFSEFMDSGKQGISNLFDAMSVFKNGTFAGMAAATAVVSAVGPAAITSGLVGIAEILGGFTLIISAFSALSHIQGFNEFVETGGTVLSNLFSQFGKIIGSAIGGIGVGATNALPEIGTNLSAFATSVKPFFETIGTLSLDGVGEFLSAFGSFMLKLAGENLLASITGTSNLPQFGSDLSEFAVSASGFFILVSTFPESGMQKAALVFESISNLGGYATKTGGIAQAITGVTELKTLGSDLTAFAEGAKGFFDIVGTFSDAGIERAPKLFDAISNLGGYATKSGGLAQLVTGSTDLPQLGSQLSEFAKQSQSFFQVMDEIGVTGITKAKLMFQALSEMGDYGFKSGGLAQIFTGSSDLSEMGRQLSDFAGAVQGFFTGVDGFSFESISKGKMIFQTLSEIGDSSFRSGGISQIFTGNVDLASIGTQLSTFGTNVEAFFIVAGRISPDSITSAKQIFAALAEMGGFVDVSLNMGNLGNAGKQLSDFINNAESFFNKASAIDVSGLKKLSASAVPLKNFLSVFTVVDSGTIYGLADSMLSFGAASLQLDVDIKTLTSHTAQDFSTMVSSVNRDVTDMEKTVISKFEEMQLSIIKSVSDIKSKAVNEFNAMVSSMTSSVSSMSLNVGSAFSGMLNSISAQVSGMASKMATYGSNMISGFARGMTSNKSAVASAANQVMEAAGDYLEHHSPARKGPGSHIVEWGSNMISGIADGMIKGKSIIAGAANGVMSTVSSIINNPINDIVNSFDNSVVSASLTQNGNITLDSTANVFLDRIISLLTDIKNGAIIRGATESYGVTLSKEPMAEIKSKVSDTETLIAEKGVRSLNVNIESGAIENHYHIDGGKGSQTPEQIMQLIELMMDEKLMPLLMDKISELKIVLNE